MGCRGTSFSIKTVEEAAEVSNFSLTDKVIAHYMSIGNGPADKPISSPTQYYTQIIPILKLSYSIALMLVPCFTFSRLSVLVLYLRIFTGRFTRICTWISVTFTLLMFITFELVTVFICNPIAHYWDPIMRRGSCLDLNFFFRSHALPNILIDLAILVIPLPTIWNLNANIARKMGLTLMFLTFSVALVVSCIRWAIWANANATSLAPGTTSRLVYIEIIETSSYLIAACLPGSYPVLILLVPNRVRLSLERFVDRILPGRGGKVTTAMQGFGRGPHAQQSFVQLVDSPSHGNDWKYDYARRGLPIDAAKTTTRASRQEERPPTQGPTTIGEDRILVHTEIEISQEERIVDVMGL